MVEMLALIGLSPSSDLHRSVWARAEPCDDSPESSMPLLESLDDLTFHSLMMSPMRMVILMMLSPMRMLGQLIMELEYG